MKLRSFLSLLWLSLFGCVLALAPVQAQDEMDGEEVADSSKSKSSKKKKAKKDKKSKKKDAKKSKSKKSKKKARDEEEEELDDEAAGDEEESDAADAAVPNATPGVAEALGKFKVFNGKPNLKAEYYIYLYSASWCGYCQQCMPIAVAEYNKMKSSRKVEMILICGDKTEAEAKEYVKSKKCKAPTIMFSELQATGFRGLPGCGMPGYPAISVVDKTGKQIKNVVGATAVKEVLSGWRALTIGGK